MTNTHHPEHAIMCPASDTGAVHHMPSKSDDGLGFANAVPTAPPPQAPQSSKEEDAEVFRRLRGLKRRFGPKPNKTELTIALITACILERWDTRRRIVGAFNALDQNYRHAVLMLTEGTGSDPKLHRWEVDAAGHYRLHPEMEDGADA
jgi:hypothetical protein